MFVEKSFKLIKRAIIITLILNSIIMIGVPSGHGYGIMVMFEFISIPMIIKNGFDFQKEYPFESSLVLIALASLVGKLMLVLLLFSKNVLNQAKWIYLGLLLMLISFLFVCYGVGNYNNVLLAITFGSGIPFLMYFGRVLYLINKEKNKSELVTEKNIQR
jgi:phosphoglycerol transferase MdoB-like AlkP superfamily enzyme